MVKSSYHNKIQAWIKAGELMSYHITHEKHHNTYSKATKTYKGKKVLIKVLRLQFRHTSLFIREQHINDYMEFITNN